MPIPFLAAATGLAQFAPMISKWIGGKHAEDITQKVVRIATTLTGKSQAHEMIESICNNPDILIAFQKEILELEKQMQDLEYQDRQDARFRDIAITRNGHRNRRPDIMVVAAALGLILCLASLGYYSEALPGEAVGIISTIAGIFGACLKDAYAFEFGSSRGSKEKDSTVAALLER